MIKHLTLTKVFALLSHLTYPEIFVTILASGHPLPVPEAIIFLGLGVIASGSAGHLLGFLLTGFAAIVTYDLVLYSFGYLGVRAATSVSKSAKSAWKERYSGASDAHIVMLIILSHFIPGWRMANPVIAAGLKIPFRKFLLGTVISALLYPAVYILMGFFLPWK
jgi:membrane protein DedA with SNARE-associated domain